MKRTTFLFLLAALMLPVFASRIGAVDFKQARSISETPGPGDFSVSVNMLGENEGVYRSGKEIRLSFQTTKDAYVVVYNIDADGYVQLLYPEDGRPVLSKGRTTYFLPPPGKNLIWEAGATTGVEYIHALAVTEPGRLNEDELYFLSRGDRLPEEKRLRIDTDPYLAFNTIDEEIVRDAEGNPPATDYTDFFVNRRVDYPRYLCAKCHSPEKLPDPYAMECPEIVIEEIAYEEKPQYPYPALYDVRHTGEDTGEGDYSSGSYAENRLEGDDNGEGDADDVHYRLSISYSTYNPYASYFGPTLLFYDPFYWDPFWWGFGWSWTWGYGYWYPGWGYSQYGWGCHDRYRWWGWDDDSYCWGYDHHRGDDYRFRPVYAERTLAKRTLDYSRTNTDLLRRRAITGSRLVETRNRDLARRLDRSDLQRRSVDRTIARETIRGSDRSAVRTRETNRRIIYGSERTIGNRERAVDRRAQTRETVRSRETPGRLIPKSERRIDTRRESARKEAPARERNGDSGRTVDRRNEPQRKSGDSDRKESTRERSGRSSTRERSNSIDRGSSGASRSSPARAYSAPARATSRPSSPPPASTRSSNTTSTKRTRSR
ncbi:MAG: DUF4384 domain-containing protein [Candidatus Krumholzibacteria bacterium]|nr:DUF4384 domain-containing protein [Candidatus Krumholzibacteria bacterium]